MDSGMPMMTVGSEINIVRSNRVILNNTICPAEIIIRNGKITNIVHKKSLAPSRGEKVMDVGDLMVMPGIVDTHVHINEPGRTAWEGFQTATKAAAAGGITTIVDMPLNSLPPTTTLSNFNKKLQAADGKCYVDIAFWGGIIPNNQAELVPMLNAGVPGFKCFMIASGVDEFPHVSCMDLHMAMKDLENTESILLFHAEVDVNQGSPVLEDPSEYNTFLKTRPDIMEVQAIQMVAELCLLYNVRCHIVHLSSAKALPIIREARQAGAPLTVETTHHYLTLTSEHIPPGATYYKCCPPIRGKDNQEALWAALHNRDIDMVVSDHSPCIPEMKLLEDGDFMKAWGGIASLQFGLPLFWTAAKQRGFTIHDLVHLMCKNTAKLCNLTERKGSLQPGWDADMVIWDPDKEFEVQEHMIHHKNKLTPYLNFHLHGTVFATIVQGCLVYQEGKFSPKPQGELLLIQQTKAKETVIIPHSKRMGLLQMDPSTSRQATMERVLASSPSVPGVELPAFISMEGALEVSGLEISLSPPAARLPPQSVPERTENVTAEAQKYLMQPLSRGFHLDQQAESTNNLRAGEPGSSTVTLETI
uniref:allantoinase n=1 Tax=Geotrypetes seraphini TaxID=260995 RepID=A0A6P8SBF1_GEOSA|nr:allantoinase, mitochondrial-like isoform X2 [Geotrypetes seraphini]